MRTLLLLLAPLCFLSGGVAGDVKPLKQFPFETAETKLFVQVRVNSSEPRWFVLDTGASESILDRTCAEQLGLKLGNERRLNIGAGSGQNLEIATARNVTFDVHGIKHPLQAVTVFPLHHVAEMMGRRVDGLLGADFIRRFVLEIDYATKTIRLHEPKSFQYQGPGREVPFRLAFNHVVVQCVLQQGEKQLNANLVVDTGAGGALYLNRPFVQEHGLIRPEAKLVTGVFGRGAGGETKGAIGRIDSLFLGPFQIAKPYAIFSQDTDGFFASNHVDGVLGAEILQRCKVFFDYSRNRMILEPYGQPKPYEYDKCGLFVIAEAPEFHRFRVVAVLPGTPAADAGIQAGDYLTQLDGKDLAMLTLSELRQKMKQPAGTAVTLRLKRGMEEKDVTLRLKRYVE